MADTQIDYGMNGTAVKDLINNNISFVNVKSFGAVGNAIANDQPAIQAAIDFAILNSIKKVFFPPGSYRIDSPILLQKQTAGVYGFFNLDLIGAVSANAGIANQAARILPSFSDAFAIGVQTARSCTVENLYLVGKFVYTKTVKQIHEQDISAWTVSGCRDSNESPYVGIAVDPFGTSVPPDGGYPGFNSYYKASAGGSSAVLIKSCYISNFVVDIAVSPNGTSSNAENIYIEKCRIYSAKIGVSMGQPQTRNCTLRDCAIFSTFNAIDTVLYGANIGSCPQVDNLLISTVKNIFNIDTSRGCATARGIEAEGFWRIGSLTGTKGLSVFGSIFKFQYGTSSTNYSKAPDTVIGSGSAGFGNVSFYSCDFNKAGDTNWNMVVNGINASFYDCVFDTINTPYSNGQAGNTVTYNNCRVLGYAKLGESINRLIPTTGDLGYFPQQGLTIHRAGGVKHEVVPNVGTANVGAITLVTNVGGDSTATFTLADTTKLRVGDSLYSISAPATFYYLNRSGLYSNTDTPYTNPFIGTVASIVGTTVTIKDIPYYVIDGAYFLISTYSTKYFGSMIGTLTSGSNVITNVYQEPLGSNFVGVRLYTESGAIPTGVYVVSEDKNARTLTLSGNATASEATVFIYTTPFYRYNRLATIPASATGKYFEIGDVVSVIGTVDRYICTATGVVGNVTHAPAFLKL